MKIIWLKVIIVGCRKRTVSVFRSHSSLGLETQTQFARVGITVGRLQLQRSASAEAEAAAVNVGSCAVVLFSV